jgi:Zn-dependent M28 family amino/carboxypeptidase
MKNFLIPAFLLLFLASCTINSQSKSEKYTITPGELEEWVSFLASDHMNGRSNGSPEMEEAAHWIARKFNEFDIKAVYPDDKLIRPYTFQSRRRDTIDERNIVGIIEGTDPGMKDEYIIITAHFDHVGIRRPVENDSIYNGADDNAAGTCTLLGVAKTIKENNYKPGRTILFAAVSGEEMGLHGSRYLVANMPLPLQNAYVNVNFEMTGHSEYLGKENYYMTGCNFSNLDDAIQEFDPHNKHNLLDTISLADRLFYMSDNIAFARIERNEGISTGIPCGTFATTTFSDYLHTPQDEARLFDFDNMAGLVDHFAEMVIWLSHSDKDIDWTDPGFTRIK